MLHATAANNANRDKGQGYTLVFLMNRNTELKSDKMDIVNM